jgi:hypothetical protein
LAISCKRSKKGIAIRGLNKNHNHDLKNIFKGTATRAAATAGPFQELLELLDRMNPTIEELTAAVVRAMSDTELSQES